MTHYFRTLRYMCCSAAGVPPVDSAAGRQACGHPCGRCGAADVAVGRQARAHLCGLCFAADVA
eukprot:16423014-Heterocapsa_arctica.AAC.1